ncbi:MAG: transglycosylase SLT domain-containing protein [Bacteroidales bacterium]|nr:transglycosylase SLT domain-containing protein [Bacteroidales bacterium]
MKKKIIFASLAVSSIAIVLLAAFTPKNSAPTQSRQADSLAIPANMYIPEKVTIFGESVPLEYFDVRESLERELLVNAFWQSQTLQFLKYCHRYSPTIDSVLAANNIPLDFKYLALAESGLRIVISPKGAAGFWQILEGTAKQHGLTVNEHIDQRYDLIKSTEAACKYLQNSRKSFNSWTMVAASYNIGVAELKTQAKFQNIDSFYDLYTNSETARYVFRIIALKLIMENPELYGYHNVQPFPTIPTKIVPVDTPIANLAEFARNQGSNYKMLKTLNPWLRDKFLPNPNNTKYYITLITHENRLVGN